MKKFLSIVLIIFIIIISYFFINYERNVIKVKDSEIIELEIKENDKVVLINKENQIYNEMISDEKLSFLPFSLLEDQDFDSDYDLKYKVITISNRKHLLRINLNKNTILLDDMKIESDNLFKIVKDEIYIDYGILNKNFDINVLYNREKKLVLIEKYLEPSKSINIIQKGSLFAKDNIESKKIRKLKIGEVFNSYEINNEWSYVYNDNLDIGYIKTKLIEEKKLLDDTSEDVSREKIVMTWDQIFHSNPNVNKIAEMKGLNVISPTWYKMKDSKGNTKSLVSQDYIKWARERNYKMWVLVSNTFNDIQMTSDFLNDVYSREAFIKNTLIEFKKYDFEGINIDFENIYMKDKDKFTQFISELVYYFDKEDIVVSVDVTVMGGSENWSKCYDRERLGKLVDYLIIMTYDEHWASSPKSGSVASFGWVKSSLEDIIDIVDSEKIIMGIPLYTRIWYETPSKTEVNKMNVRSKSITMKGQKNLLSQVNFKPIWDESSKQFYISYIMDSKLKKVWLEEKNSIKEKLTLVRELNLAGASMWSRGFETENIWDVINSEIGD